MATDKKVEKKEAVYEPDKVYLKGPDNRIYPYDRNLTKVAGWSEVVPNASARAKKAEATKAEATKTDATKTEAKEAK